LERPRLELFDFDSLRLIIEGLYQTYDQPPPTGAGSMDLYGGTGSRLVMPNGPIYGKSTIWLNVGLLAYCLASVKRFAVVCQSANTGPFEKKDN
jgi:hypothetical protein